jgi:hypothetical protein
MCSCNKRIPVRLQNKDNTQENCGAKMTKPNNWSVQKGHQGTEYRPYYDKAKGLIVGADDRSKESTNLFTKLCTLKSSTWN